MGSISFQSNISVILITIIIVLSAIYFYLDMRKIKLQIENIENNNKMFIKEVEKLSKGLHSIINYNTNIEKCPINNSDNKDNDDNDDNKDNKDNNVLIKDNIVDEEIKNEREETEEIDIIENNTDIVENNIIDDNNSILDNILNDDIDDEVDDCNNIDLDEDLDKNEDLEDESLDNEDLDNEIIDDLKDEDQDNEDIDCNEENIDSQDNILDIGLDINSDESIDILSNNNNYSDMSVKELKEKCIELGLKHSGNKHTLAQRIIDKLGDSGL